MQILNTTTGRAKDYPSSIAERLLKKKNFKAVNPNDSPTIQPAVLSEVKEHLEKIKCSSDCDGTCKSETKAEEVINDDIPAEEIEIVDETPTEVIEKKKQFGKPGRKPKK